MEIEVYTDGSYRNGIIGWAFIIHRGGQCQSGWTTGTHLQTEFVPVIEALKTIQTPSLVIVHSDCEAVRRFEKFGSHPHKVVVKIVPRTTYEIRVCHLEANRQRRSQFPIRRQRTIRECASRTPLKELLADFVVKPKLRRRVLSEGKPYIRCQRPGWELLEKGS
jgi:ribonuclease HI